MRDQFDRIESGFMHAIHVSKTLLDGMESEYQRFLESRRDSGF